MSAAAGATPTVAIVGRPNVGKSTLFNRLVGRRQAIVHDQPGVTRDRITGRWELPGDRAVVLIDTGGLVPGDDPLGLGAQVMMAVEESDLLLFVVDGREGLTPPDERVWQELRKTGKPAVLVVNKGDTRVAQQQVGEFWALGVGEPVLLSAEHGGGVPDLVEAVGTALPEVPPAEEGERPPAIAIVGRPNVGKSSLLNRLLGSERSLVSERAGTTRDPVDSLLVWRGDDGEDRTFRLVDTAGIRRRSQMSDAPEEIAVLFARRQMEQADVVVLVVDAAQGVTSGDLAIAGDSWDLGRPLVVALNKWDLLDEEGRRKLELSWERLATIAASPPRVNLSALSGRHVDRLLPEVARALERNALELPTAAVNRLFERFVAMNPGPQEQGRPWKLYYTTQVGTRPPRFMLFANRTIERGHAYRRYLENRLREELDLAGVPVRLVIRRRG